MWRCMPTALLTARAAGSMGIGRSHEAAGLVRQWQWGRPGGEERGRAGGRLGHWEELWFF